MNKHIALGRITRDLELKTTASGKNYLRFSMALPAWKKDAPPVYINYVVWEKQAEVIAQYCGKGSQLLIESEFAPYKYEKDGQQRDVAEFRVLNFEFAGSGNKGKSNGNGNGGFAKSSWSNSQGGDDNSIPF